MSERLLRLPQVIEKVSLSKSQIYKQMALGTFPQSLSLGNRCVAWTESSIDSWINNKLQQRGSL